MRDFFFLLHCTLLMGATIHLKSLDQSERTKMCKILEKKLNLEKGEKTNPEPEKVCQSIL